MFDNYILPSSFDLFEEGLVFSKVTPRLTFSKATPFLIQGDSRCIVNALVLWNTAEAKKNIIILVSINWGLKSKWPLRISSHISRSQNSNECSLKRVGLKRMVLNVKVSTVCVPLARFDCFYAWYNMAQSALHMSHITELISTHSNDSIAWGGRFVFWAFRRCKHIINYHVFSLEDKHLSALDV